MRQIGLCSRSDCVTDRIARACIVMRVLGSLSRQRAITSTTSGLEQGGYLLGGVGLLGCGVVGVWGCWGVGLLGCG